MIIDVYATYEVITEESAEACAVDERGFLHRADNWDMRPLPDGIVGAAATAWKEKNVIPLRFLSVLDAARWIADNWHDGIWDWRETNTIEDYVDDAVQWISYTLHIECDDNTMVAVCRMADIIETNEQDNYAIVDLDTGTVIGHNAVMVQVTPEWEEMQGTVSDSEIAEYAELVGWRMDDEMDLP